MTRKVNGRLAQLGERLEAFKSGRQTDPPIDNKRAEIALQRAMARLRACGKSIE